MLMKSVNRVMQKANGKVTLGESTPVKLGLVILFIGFCLSLAWWAATISAKLDVVVSDIRVIKGDEKDLKAQVDDLKLWKAETDRNGTRSLDELRKEVMMLREEFRIHSGLNGVKRP